MLEFMSLVRNIHPDVFIHSIYVEEELSEDQKAGWVSFVHSKLVKIRQFVRSTVTWTNNWHGLQTKLQPSQSYREASMLWASRKVGSKENPSVLDVTVSRWTVPSRICRTI